MALIQVALDTLDFDTTINLAKQVAPYVNIIELGTPCIKYNGIAIVEGMVSVAKNFGIQVMADLKTMDAGYYESYPFFEAGADICTVLGAADIGTIQGVIKAAKEMGKQAQVDLINVWNKDVVARQAVYDGAAIIGIHTGLDQQASGGTPFEALQSIMELGLSVKISVAGGINKNTIARAITAGADIVVVGASIYGASDPSQAAAEIREATNHA
jgi:3-hexulose-6-phosphate synthase